MSDIGKKSTLFLFHAHIFVLNIFNCQVTGD